MSYDEAKADALDALSVVPGDLFRLGLTCEFMAKDAFGQCSVALGPVTSGSTEITVTLSDVWDALNRRTWRRNGSLARGRQGPRLPVQFWT